MDAPATAELPSDSRRSGALPVLRFIGWVVLLGLVVYATAILVAVLVPEQDDYALSSALKHQRLETAEGRRVILVGGSNLAFGIDSNIIATETGCSPVNMGMNGYFGIRYMLREIKDDVREGDIVVIAFEWDNFFKTVNGSGDSLLVVTKANPKARGYLSPEQWLEVGLAIPYVARQKTLRLGREAIDNLRALVGAPPAKDADSLIYTIETVKGFTPLGDLTTHLGVEWPFEFEGAIVTEKVETEAIDLIGAFSREMKERGVDVVISYTPILGSEYEMYAPQFEQVYEGLSAAVPGAVPAPPSEYAYADESLFFDTVYHLNAEGRAIRTKQLVDDIRQVLGSELCAADPLSATGVVGAEGA